jgi:uncharacterized protein (TIGR02145 family)
MKPNKLIALSVILLIPVMIFAQDNMTIKGGGAVTVIGNLVITNGCGDPIIDSRDGKSYNTVRIGTQCWMAQNLNIGTRIAGGATQTNNGIIEKYCYDNIESNCNVYGGLYQWDEAMQFITTEGAKGVCPTGWHIPALAEWDNLDAVLGGYEVAGGKMKEAGLTHWVSPNAGATNSSGFTGLPGGHWRSLESVFTNLHYFAIYWMSSRIDANIIWYKYLGYYNFFAGTDGDDKTNGYSVRCLKN